MRAYTLLFRHLNLGLVSGYRTKAQDVCVWSTAGQHITGLRWRQFLLSFRSGFTFHLLQLKHDNSVYISSLLSCVWIISQPQAHSIMVMWRSTWLSSTVALALPLNATLEVDKQKAFGQSPYMEGCWCFTRLNAAVKKDAESGSAVRFLRPPYHKGQLLVFCCTVCADSVCQNTFEK